MSSQNITLQPSASKTATGQTASQKMAYGGSVAVMLNVTAVTGTLPTLDIWIQGSLDDSTWFDVPYDFAMTTSASGNDVTATEAKRNINGGSALAATAKCMAIYRFWPFEYARGSYVLGGTTPDFTFSLEIRSRLSGA